MSNHTLQIFLEIKEGEGNNWWSWENTDPGAWRDFKRRLLVSVTLEEVLAG